MASPIAIVGVGPGMGFSVAQRFGAAGHPVALIARNRERLGQFAKKLAADGIQASAYPADVTDEAGLTSTLNRAADELGTIGILAYVPSTTTDHSFLETGEMPDFTSMSITPAVETTAESARKLFELQVAGAITATRAVLPAMRDAKEGTLLYTTGISSVHPVPPMGNFGIAQSGLRNWLTNLHNMLAGEGIYVGHVSIGGIITRSSSDGSTSGGMTQFSPDDLADRLYQIAEARDKFETTIGF